MPIFLAFIDYGKSFDFIEFESLLNALMHQRVNPAYIKIIRGIYIHSNASQSEKIQLGRGARQRDNISPKLIY